MNDVQLRKATKRSLHARHRQDPETFIFDEFAVAHGASRIDLAVVNGELHGIELKSDEDTLARLPQQVRAFSGVFDRITLVSGECHVQAAVDLVPDWWGVRVAYEECGEILFCDLKLALQNPSQDLAALAALLWRQEALDLLEDLGIASGVRTKPRADLYSRLAEKSCADLLANHVRVCLRERREWRSAGTRLSCGG
jgi:hypothetical protein